MFKAVNLVRKNCSLIETLLSWWTKAVLMRMGLVKRLFSSLSILVFQVLFFPSKGTPMFPSLLVSGDVSVGNGKLEYGKQNEDKVQKSSTIFLTFTFLMPWVKYQVKKEGEILIRLGCFSLLLLDSLLLLTSQKPTALPPILDFTSQGWPNQASASTPGKGRPSLFSPNAHSALWSISSTTRLRGQKTSRSFKRDCGKEWHRLDMKNT